MAALEGNSDQSSICPTACASAMTSPGKSKPASNIMVKPIGEWAETDVALWLRRFSTVTDDLMEELQKHAITGAILLTIEEGDLVDMGIRKFGHRRLLLVAAQELRATINGLRGVGNGGDLEKQQFASKKILPAPNAEPITSGCWPSEDGQNTEASPRQHPAPVVPPGMVGPLPLQTLHQTVAQPPLQHFVHGNPQVAFFPQPLSRTTVPVAFGVPGQQGLSTRVAAANVAGSFVAAVGPAPLPPGSAQLRVISPRPGGPWSNRSTLAMEPACNLPAYVGPASARMAASTPSQQCGATPSQAQTVGSQRRARSPHCHL